MSYSRSANYSSLISRLREQASAGGHRWVDVMALLLEAAQRIEDEGRLFVALYNEAALEHIYCPCCGGTIAGVEGRDSQHGDNCDIKRLVGK
jgi:hypothetical protein